MIPLCAPHIRHDEWSRIKECVDTEWVSYAGKYVEQFEHDLAQFTQAEHAVVTISGTSALHLALITVGVGIDDEVILPALSFVSPANSIRYCGAWPTFVDIDLDTWQMDVDQVADFLRNGCHRDSDGILRNSTTQRRVAALMPVHLLGDMADLGKLAQLAEEFDLPLIEDGAESLGAKWNGKPFGAPLPNEERITRIACTSFNGNKIMTTGGGGALFTNCKKIAQLAKHLSTTAKTDVIEFDHDQVGYNYRMSNMAAALGVGQLNQLPQFIQRKQQIAQRYCEAFAHTPQITATLKGSDNVDCSFWLYTIRCDRNSRDLLKYLGKLSIQTRPLWKVLSTLSYLDQCHVISDENSHTLVDQALSIPCSVGLTDEEQDSVIKGILDFFKENP